MTLHGLPLSTQRRLCVAGTRLGSALEAASLAV